MVYVPLVPPRPYTQGAGLTIPLRELRGWDASCEYADLLHALWLGTARDAVASHLLLYAQYAPDLEMYPTWDERLRQILADFKAWCNANKIRASVIDEMSLLVQNKGSTSFSRFCRTSMQI